MVLREKGLPYVRHTVGTAPAEVRKLLGDISPRGEVPVLMDLRPPGISNEPVVLHDSSVICEYLDEAYPANPVFPKDPALRSKCRIIDDAMDTHLEGVTWALNEVFAFNRAGPSGSPLRTKIVSAAMAEIKVWYAWLEQQLDGSKFLCGDQFSYADISAASILMGTTSYRALPEKGSQLEAWWNLVSARPSVKEIIQVNIDETLTMKAAVGNFSKGTFKRQYRDHRLEFLIRAGGLEIVAEGLKKDNIRFTDPREFVRVGGNLVKGGKAWVEMAKL